MTLLHCHTVVGWIVFLIIMVLLLTVVVVILVAALIYVIVLLRRKQGKMSNLFHVLYIQKCSQITDFSLAVQCITLEASMISKHRML